MKKYTALLAVSVLALSACSNTWQGVKADSTENKQHVENAVEKAQDAAEKGWDKTKSATKEGWDKTKDVTQEGWDKTKEATKEGLQKVEQHL